MPPNTSAGLMALAGSPPGAAAGVKPAQPPADGGVLDANLFASLLAQSRLPAPPGNAARSAPILSAKVILNAKLVLNAARPDLKLLKTMDTSPKLLLHSKDAAKAKASELLPDHALVPTEQVHKTAADNTVASLPGVPVSALGLASTIAAPVVAAVALSPAPRPAVVASMPAAVAAAPPMMLAAAAPSLVPASAPMPQGTISMPQGTTSNPQGVAATAAPPKLITPNLQLLAPMQSALPGSPAPLMPRAGTLSSVVSNPPQAGPSALPPVQAPLTTELASAALPAAQAEASTPAPLSVKLLSVSTQGVPQLISLARLVEQTRANRPNLDLAQSGLTPPKGLAAPQDALPLLRLPAVLAPADILGAAPAAVLSVLAAPLVLPAAGDPALPTPTLPKSAEKSVLASLKPAAENADTITRTLPVQTARSAAIVSGQTAAPAPIAEKSAAPQEASGSVTLDVKKIEQPDAALKTQAAPVGTQIVPETSAAGPSLKPLSLADHAAMVRQVADGVGTMPLPAKPGAVQQMSLQLHPKDWGSLQVSVSVTAGPDPAAKTVTAHIVAETPQVKAALQSQMPALHQALRASGLNLEHLTVSVKPASETVKAASQSESGGFPSEQGQAGAGGSQPQTGQPSGASAFGSMASGGGSQDGRQGQTPPAPASIAAPPEPDEIVIERLPIRPILSRIDTLA